MTGMVRGKATVLVADDDLEVLRVTAATLNRLGYEVLTASSGEAALKLFDEAPQTIHLVISDMLMPDMQGPQLIRAIKGISPSVATLLMSGSWRMSDSSPSSIGKPFQMPALINRVRELLGGCDLVEIEREQASVRTRQPPRRTAKKHDETSPARSPLCNSSNPHS